MAKVKTYVYVMHEGYPVLLSPGDTIPEGVTVTNPDVLDEADEPDEPAKKAPARKTPADS